MSSPYSKSRCDKCQNWDKTKIVPYEAGKMGPCLQLSGRHSPTLPATKVYSLHFRGGSENIQTLFTRFDFYCNKFQKMEEEY